MKLHADDPPDADASPTPVSPPVIVGRREQLFHLLAEASEIEHTLMCSYLYAVFSLKRPDSPEFSAREADAVTRWRKAILGVATEEMSHLLLVANLSVAVGGRPHFDRPNFPVAPGHFPSGVVVKLAPFSQETLQHFIFLERPLGIVHPDGEGFTPDVEYEREEAFHGLMPSVQDYSTVGALYEALKANLIACCASLGEASVFIGPEAAQVGPTAVAFDEVGVIDGLGSALRAIDAIVEQGEGSPGDREDSHYQRFLAIQNEYQELFEQNPSFAPAWPAAQSPVMRRPPEPEGKTFIRSRPAARVLDYGNAVYSLLLRCLVQAFGRTGGDAGAEQKRYINAALGLMHVLSQVAAVLVTLPANARAPGVNAGMSFTMLRSVEPFLQGLSERLLMKERLQELISGASGLERDFVQLENLSLRVADIATSFNAVVVGIHHP